MGYLNGNFSANGDSDSIVVSKATITLGNETNGDFGGGTVDVLIKQDAQQDFTVDSSYTATGVFVTKDTNGVEMKLRLSGSTSPNLDYSIKY